MKYFKTPNAFLNYRRYVSNHPNYLKVFSSNQLNFLGYIHGGSILKSLCDDGLKRAKEFVKLQPNKNQQMIDEVVLTRMEKVTFRKPVLLNDLIVEKSAVVFDTPNSICVECSLQLIPQNLSHDNFTTVCDAILWFTPVSVEKCDKNHTIKLHPQKLESSNISNDTNQWRDLYNKHKMDRNNHEITNAIKDWETYMSTIPYSIIISSKASTAPASFASNEIIISKEYCFGDNSSILDVGSLLKIIDETGAISAMRHVKANCVTGFIDNVNFYNPGIKSHILSVYAQVEYTSKSSVYVGVRVFDENHITSNKNLICSCVLVFVPLAHNNCKPTIPKLVLEHPYERTKFEEKDKLHSYYREHYFNKK